MCTASLRMAVLFLEQVLSWSMTVHYKNLNTLCYSDRTKRNHESQCLKVETSENKISDRLKKIAAAQIQQKILQLIHSNKNVDILYQFQRCVSEITFIRYPQNHKYWKVKYFKSILPASKPRGLNRIAKMDLGFSL